VFLLGCIRYPETAYMNRASQLISSLMCVRILIIIWN